MTDRIDLRSLATPELLRAGVVSDALTHAETLFVDHSDRSRAGYAEELEAIRELGNEAYAEYLRLRKECGLQRS